MATAKSVYGLDRVKAEVGAAAGKDYQLTADITIPALTGRALAHFRADADASFEEMLHAILGEEATALILAQSPSVCMALLEDVFQTIGANELLGGVNPFGGAEEAGE